MNKIPEDAKDIEVFAIKSVSTECKNNETAIGSKSYVAYIGFKLQDGSFHYIQVPYTGNLESTNILGNFKIESGMDFSRDYWNSQEK